MASAPPRHLRIFLASPGDVLDEREIALQVLDGLPYDPLLRGKVTIEDVAWDKRGAGAPLLAGVTPQDSIARGLPLPADCDIVVVLFWSRMGTPLPPPYQKEDGSPYESGTEWEYENAVTAFRKHGSPYVLLYRRTQPITLDADASDFDERRAEYDKVKRFFADPSIGGYTRYDTPGDFREHLEHDLKSLIMRLLLQGGGKRPSWESSRGIQRGKRAKRISVFISYARESEGHRIWVRKLALLLEELPDFHVIFDEFDLFGGKDLTRFMESARSADRVVMVVTPGYVRKAERRRGGVGYETSVISADMMEERLIDRVVPVLRRGKQRPSFVRSKVFVDFRNDTLFETAFEQLRGALLQLPPTKRPTKME